jgi:hypothetical protein
MNRMIVPAALAIVAFFAGLWFSGVLIPSKPKAASIAAAPKSDTQEDARTILHQAIEAHGGAAILDKYKAIHNKTKGYYFIRGVRCDITSDEMHQRPDKMKQVITLKGNGKQVEVITLVNGKKMWSTVGRSTKAIDDERILTSVRQEMLIESPGTLVEFLEPPYELTNLGVVQVRGQDAVNIRVSTKGQNDLLFFFDKKTHLIVKTQARTFDTDLGLHPGEIRPRLPRDERRDRCQAHRSHARRQDLCRRRDHLGYAAGAIRRCAICAAVTSSNAARLIYVSPPLG